MQPTTPIIIVAILAFWTERDLRRLKHRNYSQFSRYHRLHVNFNQVSVILLIITGWQLAKGHYALMLGTYLIVLLDDTFKWHRIWQATKN